MQKVMQKELNLDLFNEQTRNLDMVSFQPLNMQGENEPEFLNNDKKISELKKANHELQESMHQMKTQFAEYIKAAHLKMEKLTSQIQRLEQNHNGLAHEANQKITQLIHKVSERRIVDSKIEEMVDRHNNLLKTYEVRLNHLQRLISEKESQQLQTQAALNEAKMEIARLKRL